MFTLFIGTESDRNGDKIDARVARTAFAQSSSQRLSSLAGIPFPPSMADGLTPVSLPVEEIALRLELIIDGNRPENDPVASAFAFAQWCAGQLNQSAVLLVGPVLVRRKCC